MDYSGADTDNLDLDAATSQIGVWEIDVATGEASRNLRHDQVFGYINKVDSWAIDVFLSHVVDRDRDRVADLMHAAANAGDYFSFETEITSAQGDQRWIAATGKPKFGADGKITHMIGHVIDITASRHREEQIKLALNDLNHRVGNTIAVIQSMVEETATTASDFDSFVDGLSARLDVMARANRMLTNDPDAQKLLRCVIEGVLQPYHGVNGRVSIHGSLEIAVSPRAAEAVTLVLHELMINALQHGSLSNGTGLLDISFTPNGVGDITINWQELGGPRVTAAVRKGFGTVLIDRALDGIGSATQHYAPGGMLAEVRIRATSGAD